MSDIKGEQPMYTNNGLVNHAKKALELNTKYMWGGILKPIDNKYISALRSIYGISPEKGYTEARYTELKKLAGKGVFGCDCVGLIKSYYWSGKENGGTGSPNNPYDNPNAPKGYPDVNAGMMYNAAKIKGTINTMPEIKGLIVYCKTHPHVGIYIGNGEVIECTLSKRGDGVVKTNLKDFTWEYWMKCPYIDYITQAGPRPTAQKAGQVISAYLAYNARVREKPFMDARQVAYYKAGCKISYIYGSDIYDAKSNYTYVKLADGDKWIVKSAIKGA